MQVRDWVQCYIDFGLRPMPMYGVDELEGLCLCGRSDCRAGKHSRDEEAWKHGRYYQACEFTEFDNVAIALGPWRPDSWLVCFDCDGTIDPTRFFPFPLSPTLMQKSPRGLHLFFAVRPYEPLGNWVDVFETKYSLGYALDVRYARGRINVAPSRTNFGTYEWLDWREPAPLPEFALQRILSERRRRGLPVESRWDRGGKRP